MRLWNHPRWRLELQIAGAVLVLIAVATFASAAVAWSSKWSQSDRLAAVGVVLAGGGLCLALFAAVVATLAYAAAIEQPDLLALLTFHGSDTNEPVLVVDPTVQLPANWNALAIADFPQVTCEVRLENRSPYTARSPVVRIELMNMWDLSAAGFWQAAKPNVPGAKVALRWSSGEDRSVSSVHGSDIAPIGYVSFKGVLATAGARHEMVVQVFAEGYRNQNQHIPVKLQTPVEWCAVHPERRDQLPNHLRGLV